MEHTEAEELAREVRQEPPANQGDLDNWADRIRALGRALAEARRERDEALAEVKTKAGAITDLERAAEHYRITRDTARARLEAVERVAERCERWTTPRELGEHFAGAREGAFRDCAMWLRAALAGSGAGEGKRQDMTGVVRPVTGAPDGLVLCRHPGCEELGEWEVFIDECEYQTWCSRHRPTPPERGAGACGECGGTGRINIGSAAVRCQRCWADDPTPPPGGKDEPGALDHMSDEDCRKELEAVWSALGGHMDRVNVHPSGEEEECAVAECVAAVVREHAALESRAAAAEEDGKRLRALLTEWETRFGTSPDMAERDLDERNENLRLMREKLAAAEARVKELEALLLRIPPLQLHLYSTELADALAAAQRRARERRS